VGSITADWWCQVSEMSDDQVAESLRLYPDWTEEQAEHFIDSSYREIAAEVREAGDSMIHKIVEEIERQGREASN